MSATEALNPQVIRIKHPKLRFDEREDIDSYLSNIEQDVLEEFYIGDNTVGVNAAKSLEDLFPKLKSLKVMMSLRPSAYTCKALIHRCFFR
jgi:Ran GTPase-activating protein (RanGAP) involved in mRNA processing and transport